MTIIERLADLFVPRVGSEAYERREVRAVEGRWRRINAEKRAAGCRCGSPATEVRYLHGNVGSVPVEVWTCAEHVGVSAWAGGVPCWERSSPCESHTPDRCGGWGGPIGGPTTRWHCPEREVGTDA